jgi:hypothetical protein
VVWLNLTMLFCILWSSNCCESNTQIGRNLVFLNSPFCTCIPILFMSISYPCIVRILKFKQALTQLLLLQTCVKENLVWFVLLLRCCVPPQLNCSNDGRVHHSRDPLSRLSFAASHLLPCRRRPRQLHYHHQLSRWPWELHGSAREVALFRVCLRFASLNMMTCYIIIVFTY